jgi:hypothetical protein
MMNEWNSWFLGISPFYFIIYSAIKSITRCSMMKHGDIQAAVPPDQIEKIHRFPMATPQDVPIILRRILTEPGFPPAFFHPAKGHAPKAAIRPEWHNGSSNRLLAR